MTPDIHDPLTAKIAAFLMDIGIRVRAGDLPHPTFLPGIEIQRGVLVIDETRLTYRGDLLHEAGHLAVLSADEREQSGPEMGSDGGFEMAAIAWSYAAALYLRIDPAVVFHEHGYRGSSQAYIENFGEGRYLGVPMIEWLGLTVDHRRAKELGVAAYPHMIKWLRD